MHGSKAVKPVAEHLSLFNAAIHRSRNNLAGQVSLYWLRGIGHGAFNAVQKSLFYGHDTPIAEQIIAAKQSQESTGYR